eukprot:11781119-Alexandrium_andersonii.AAC.1
MASPDPHESPPALPEHDPWEPPPPPAEPPPEPLGPPATAGESLRVRRLVSIPGGRLCELCSTID